MLSLEMIPDPELDLLLNTVTAAVDCLQDRRPVQGYLSLLAGLNRAREMVAEVEWGPRLVLLYAGALNTYASEHLPAN